MKPAMTPKNVNKIGGAQIIEMGGEAILYGEVSSTEELETDLGSSTAFHGLHRARFADGSELEAPTIFFPGRAERIMLGQWHNHRSHQASGDEPRGNFQYRVRVWVVKDPKTPTGYGWRFEEIDHARKDRLQALGEEVAQVEFGRAEKIK